MRELLFECEITTAVNPVSYEEVQLEPPVKIRTWDEFNRFNDEWERFCRHAADRGVNPRVARFEL